MTDTKSVCALVDKSFGRCRMTGTFIDDFYTEFLGSSPVVAEKFKNTDMEQQKRLLDQGIRHLILFYHEPSAITAAKMTGLGESHAKSALDIGADLYELWLAALLKTVADNDPKFDAELEAAWREVANHGIAVMLSMHDD